MFLSSDGIAEKKSGDDVKIVIMELLQRKSY